MLLSFAHDGECGMSGVWTTITAAKGFHPLLLNVPATATHYVRYITGGTAALKIGETLTGGTSSSTAILVAQVVEVGTAGSGDTGIIFVNKKNGTFQGETLIGGSSTGTVIIAQELLPLMVAGLQPKAALITVETATIDMTMDGTNPTATAGTNYGHQMTAGQSYVVRGYNSVAKFQCINAVGGNGAIVKYSLFY